eukprot:3332053-Rhodomonas_salina.1
MLVIACCCMLRERISLQLSVCQCVLDVEDGACLLLAHARGVLLAVSTWPGPWGKRQCEGATLTRQGESKRGASAELLLARSDLKIKPESGHVTPGASHMRVQQSRVRSTVTELISQPDLIPAKSEDWREPGGAGAEHWLSDPGSRDQWSTCNSEARVT